MDTFKLLQNLTETPGPSGNEKAIANVVREWWEPYANRFISDRVGNLMAMKEGSGDAPRRTILLAAHMDEIALMVHQIVAHNGNGFLRVTNVGGVDIRHLYGQLVVVHGENKTFSGVIGSLPGAMLPADKQNKPFGFEELVIDVGLPMSEVEAEIAVGDFVSFRQPLRKLLNGRITGKALDNRASVAAVTIALDYLSQRSHSWDVIAVATVQEETRLLGAFTSAHSQQPDLAIAIDVTFGKGPGANDTGTVELGSGPMLDLGPNVHTGMYKALKKTAESLEMSIETGTHSRASGTDAFGVQVARSGIPTGLISIPLRYMHTMVESIDLKDMERCGRLMGEFIAQLDDKFLETLAAGMMEEDSKQ